MIAGIFFALLPLQFSLGAQETVIGNSLPTNQPAGIAHGSQASTTAKVTTMPDSIPVKRNADTPPEDDQRMWWALAFLLVVGGIGAFAVVWRSRVISPIPKKGNENSTLVSRWTFPKWRGNPAIQVLSTTRLTPRHSIHEVQWSGRKLLIGCAGDGIRLLVDSPLSVSETQEIHSNTTETSNDLGLGNASSSKVVNT